MEVKVKGLEKFEPKDGYVRDELAHSDILTLERQVRVDMVNKQDQMIMDVIRTIGGTTYEHITVDQGKVLAALEKTVKKRPVKEPYHDFLKYICPVCNMVVTTGQPDGRPFYPQNYCGVCGQALNWDGLTDRGGIDIGTEVEE